MAKTKVVNQKHLVTEIMNVGGVNRENAVSIFNIFTNAWNTDRIGMLKAVDNGIAVKKTRKAPANKKTVKRETVKPLLETSTKKKAKGSTPVAKLKTKSKGKKKLKAKKAKTSIPAGTKNTQTATA